MILFPLVYAAVCSPWRLWCPVPAQRIDSDGRRVWVSGWRHCGTEG